MSVVVTFHRWCWDWNIFFFKEFRSDCKFHFKTYSSSRTMFFTQVLQMMPATEVCLVITRNFHSLPKLILNLWQYLYRSQIYIGSGNLLYSLYYAWSPLVSRNSKKGTPTTSLVENLWKNHLLDASIRLSFEWPLRFSTHSTPRLPLELKTFAKPEISPFEAWVKVLERSATNWDELFSKFYDQISKFNSIILCSKQRNGS